MYWLFKTFKIHGTTTLLALYKLPPPYINPWLFSVCIVNLLQYVCCFYFVLAMSNNLAGVWFLNENQTSHVIRAATPPLVITLRGCWLHGLLVYRLVWALHSSECQPWAASTMMQPWRAVITSHHTWPSIVIQHAQSDTTLRLIWSEEPKSRLASRTNHGRTINPKPCHSDVGNQLGC